MANELAYVLINPYTMYKSRTGGVMSRLLSRSSNLRLIGARMFAPSRALVEEYIAALAAEVSEQPEAREVDLLVQNYVREHYMPGEDGRPKRVMLLLLEGDDAVARLRNEVVGSIIRQTVGETVRDTYGDLIRNKHGEVIYFEPAVLIARTAEAARRHIGIWLKYSDTDSGILYNVVPHSPGAQIEQTLVMIKPDTLAQSRTRTGTVIDLFAKTGLYIVAIKVIHMSVAQAMEFYRPVREVFIEKFAGRVRERARAALQTAFEFPVPDSVVDHVAHELRVPNADHEFGKIVQFMTGLNPWQTPPGNWSKPGLETCLALVYEGTDAVAKIRAQLGSTDPSKAAPATVRKEFGRDVMVNTAHASDSPENAQREIGILGIADNDLHELVARYQ